MHLTRERLEHHTLLGVITLAVADPVGAILLLRLVGSLESKSAMFTVPERGPINLPAGCCSCNEPVHPEPGDEGGSKLGLLQGY